MRKVVWILNHYAQAPGGPGGTRHYGLARHLQNLGWDCVLIAASAEHGTGQQRLSPNESYRVENVDGVRFLWLRTPAYQGNGTGRIRNMLAYTFRVLRRSATAMLPKPDVVIGSSVHPLAAWAALRLSRRFGTPFVFEVRDLWPETLVDMGRLKKDSLVAKALYRLEKHLYQQAARIISVLPGAVDYIASLGISRQKVQWVPNGAEVTAHWEADEPAADPFVFMYFGGHGVANALDGVLRAYERARHLPGMPPSVLRLIGDGPVKAELQALANKLGVQDGVLFEAPVKKSDIPDVAAQAHAFVLHAHDLPIYRFGISFNKLFDYLAAGRPVLFGCNAVNNPVQEAQAGITVAADDEQAMAQAMRAIATATPQQRQAMGNRGRALVREQYSYERLAGQLAAVLDDVVTSR